ncbi:MAG TPA: type II toxin-antitoxin system HicA family toxin [Verrucomicrobiota bacterium]|nr:type II toxin-antitoxin system HicA family toxin [Verrucomicrobiota bacterium]
MRLIQGDGWFLARTRGSRRHFKHPAKPGIVTVTGPP